MAKWGPLLCDMHRVEAQHLRERLRIAMAALEEIKETAQASEGVEFYAMLAERALARIEGDE